MPGVQDRVFLHPIGTAEWSIALRHALQILQWHLPAAIPLYRRLQIGHFNSSATIMTSIEGLCNEARKPANLDIQKPWLIAVLDRACRPEAEMWIYGSWESSSAVPSDNERRTWASLARAFAAKYQTITCPPSIHVDVLPELAVPTDIMTMGAVHEKTIQVFAEANVLDAPERLRGSNTTAYAVYIFDIDGDTITQAANSEAESQLPQGLYWGQLEPLHMNLVCSRSPYPRQAKSLARMPNVGVFEKTTGEPVAWAFVGADGSLTSLHVEEQWRRQGIAGLVTRRLFGHGMHSLLEHDAKLTDPHRARITQAYVAKGNTGSEKMCHSLGGQVMWDCFYFRTSLREQVRR